MTETFRIRAAGINDHASNSEAAQRGGGGRVGNDSVEFSRGLDEIERGLFRTQHDSAKAARVWMGEMKN